MLQWDPAHPEVETLIDGNLLFKLGVPFVSVLKYRYVKISLSIITMSVYLQNKLF